MQEITNIITGSALSILTIFAGIVVKLVKDYLLKKGGEKAVKIAEIVARNAVEAVEQIAYDNKDIKGIEKLTEAKVAVRDELSKHNVYLSDKQMEVFIEAAVKRMNDNWKGQ
ncbi:N-acetylmuramoyl-L-alanine amidase [Streptococcus canis]|uniref:phage holin n=1 Tax=Streptococcus canis TaxID=1329 RepID=UPI0010DD76C5|nr:phage holin [Streptococcus canis]VTS69623.1 N-acetylmuramoyl-L-alanine amidase [Streptococcus canis]VTS75327.1 N-acetylmuramoyl-L-alanine amidase [Streptococcus canis]